MNEIVTKKQIFQCLLTGDPIVFDRRDVSGKMVDDARLLLWQTGIIRLVQPDNFNKELFAKAEWTHPVHMITYDTDFVQPAGHRFSMSYSIYKWLISRSGS